MLLAAALATSLLGGLVAVTQILAEAFGYAEGLGRTAFGPFYSPLRAFEWSPYAFDVYPKTVSLAWVGGVAATLVLFVVCCAFLSLCLRPLEIEDTGHGSSRWAEREDLVKSSLLDGPASGTSLIVAGWQAEPDKKDSPIEYLTHSGPESMAVFGGSGSAKTASVIIPNLLSYESSAFAIDIRGDLRRKTAGYRRKMLGHRVLWHDPSSTDPGNASFNPLAEVDVCTLGAVRDVQMILEYLVPSSSGKGVTSGNAQHFTDSARSLGVGVFLCEMSRAALEKGETNVPDVLSVITDPERPFRKYLRDVMQSFEGLTTAVDRVVRETATEMLNRDEKEFSSVLSSLVTPLTKFRDPILANAVSRSDFRLLDLVNGDDPMDLYLTIRPSDRHRLKHYFGLFVSLLFQKLLDSTDDAEIAVRHPLWACLDEFTSLPTLPVVQEGMDVMRNYKIKATIVVQDLDSLAQLYGESERFTANSKVQVGYTPSKPKTAQYFSSWTGTTTVRERTRSTQQKWRALVPEFSSTSESLHARPLMTPDEVQRLRVPRLDADDRMVEPGEALVFARGCYPIRGIQTPYFMDQEMAARASYPPPSRSDVRVADRAALRVVPDGESHGAVPAA